MIRPRPSMFAGRVSIRTTCPWSRTNSAASSIVTIRSLAGMASAMAPRNVVLPEPVPPEIRMFLRATMAARRNCSIAGENIPSRIRSSQRSRRRPKRRIDSVGPSSVTGGSVAFTRLPSASRASTIGDASSMRRPMRAAIRWMIRTRCSLSRNRTSVSSSRPKRSMYTWSKPVDEDVGHGRIGHQRGQRADAQASLPADRRPAASARRRSAADFLRQHCGRRTRPPPRLACRVGTAESKSRRFISSSSRSCSRALIDWYSTRLGGGVSTAGRRASPTAVGRCCF